MAAFTPSPPSLLGILTARCSFVSSKISTGSAPAPAQLAKFLKDLVEEVAPHAKTAPPSIASAVKEQLQLIGWDVSTNSPLPGSLPPTPANLLSALTCAIATVKAAMLPPLPAAERSVETAEKQLADDERERGFIREALEEEDVTDKKMRQLAKQLATLDNSVTESTRAAGTARGTLEEVLASLSEGERAARDERLRQKKVAAPSSASAPPPPRAAPTSRHPQQQQQQQQQEPVTCGEGEIEYLQASELRKGNLVLLGGRVCKITDVSTSKTGKHGHAKVQITAKVANTGKNVTDSITSQNKAEIPSKAWSATHKAGLKF